jgi:hypothetical protein
MDQHQLGMMLERLSDTSTRIEQRVGRLERTVRRISEQMQLIWTWGRRGALVAGIWAGAVWTNLNAETKAELILQLIGSLP